MESVMSKTETGTSVRSELDVALTELFLQTESVPIPYRLRKLAERLDQALKENHCVGQNVK